MFSERHDDVLPALFRVQDPIAVDPPMANVLRRVEDNPLVYTVDEIKITQVGKEIGLHDSQFHTKNLANLVPSISRVISFTIYGSSSDFQRSLTDLSLKTAYGLSL